MNARNEGEARSLLGKVVAASVRIGLPRERPEPVKHWPACASGPCAQGRKPCPSPMECQVAERIEATPRLWIWLALAAIIVFAIVVAVARATR